MIKETLRTLEYSDDDIAKIVEHEKLKKYKEETLAQNIKEVFSYLKTLGYTKEEVIKMTRTFPNIFHYSIEKMKQKDLMKTK